LARKKKKFRGRGWAIFALTGMVLLWGWRWAEQGRARAMAENTQIAAAPVKRMALEPYPINPFHWHAILETAEYYQTAEINTLSGEIVSDPRRDVILQAAGDRGHRGGQTHAAGAGLSGLGHVGGGARRGPEPIPGAGHEAAAVAAEPDVDHGRVLRSALRLSVFREARTPSRPHLSGWVYIVDGRDEAGEAMNGREQR
jgi:inner membrane protein